MFEKFVGFFDLIINMVSVNIDINVYFGLFMLDGIFVNVGVFGELFVVNVMFFIGYCWLFVGFMIGGICEI